jgi:putative DNA primase/helicase
MPDFNDVHKEHGPEAVRDKITTAEKVRYIPFGYKIEGNTLCRIDGEDKTPICDPLYIEALARDSGGDNWGRLLVWQDQDKRWHEWAMPNVMLAGDGAEYRRILLAQGLCIRAGRKAQNALHDYILSATPLSRALSVTSPGWHGKQYIRVDNTVYGKGSDRVLLQVGGPLPKLEKSGTLEDWQDNVARYALGNSRLVFAISVALAGVLLYPSNEGSGGFHFAGGSSTGKTTGLRVAASVWGLPLRSWRTTDNAAESWARFSNDAFLPIDELGQVDGKAADAMAYMLGNGQTKGRARKDGIARETAEFRLMFLSTGEIGLAEKLGENRKQAKAGQTVRMLEIPADAGAKLGIFEHLHDFSSADEFAKHLSQMAQETCGHAAHAFLCYLEKQEFQKLQHAIAELTKNWLSSHVPQNADGQVKRAARRFALVAVSGELASAAGILPWHDKEAGNAAARCLKDWINSRGGAGSHEVQEGLKNIENFIVRYGSSRFADMDSPNEKIIDRAGFRRTEQEKTEYLFFPNVFRKDVLGGSKNAPAIIQAAIEQKIIQPDAEGKSARNVRIPGIGQKRMICVTLTSDQKERGELCGS